jgi:hypothetical protein
MRADDANELQFFNVGPAIETVDRLNGVTDAVGRTNVSTTVLSAQASGKAPVVSISHAAMLCSTVMAALLLA